MICALLSFYDEKPEWLADLVESLPRVGVTHLVALDGGYAAFPGARPCSDDRQHRTLVRAARKARIGLTLETPTETWGSEMVKRTHLFRLGETATIDKDWFLVVDGDERVTEVVPDLHTALGFTDLDCAEVTLSEPHPAASTKTFPMRMFFRAIRGLTVVTNHYTYMDGGRKLWGRGREEPALDLTSLIEVEHRTHFRPTQRKAQARDYYKRRDSEGHEIGRCERCGEPGVKELPFDWQPVEPHPITGDTQLSADWISVCRDCELIVHEENRVVVDGHGLDYSTIQVTYQRVRPNRVAA